MEYVKYQEYKKLFGIKDSIPLLLFENLLNNSKEARIECSHKICLDHVYSQRINIWYHTDFHYNLNLIFEFFRKIDELKGVTLNFSLLRNLITRFELHKIDDLICGIDLRPETVNSRVKVWFDVNKYHEKIQEVLQIFGQHKITKKYVNQNKLLFGIDMYFNGSTELKIYPEFNEKEYAGLKGLICQKVLVLIKKCTLIHISFNKNLGNIIHFHLNDPKKFIDMMHNKHAKEINNKYMKKGYPLKVISLSEKEILAENLNEINLYY